MDHVVPSIGCFYLSIWALADLDVCPTSPNTQMDKDSPSLILNDNDQYSYDLWSNNGEVWPVLVPEYESGSQKPDIKHAVLSFMMTSSQLKQLQLLSYSFRPMQLILIYWHQAFYLHRYHG